MTRKLLWVLLLAGCVAMVWYGATGETGPMQAPSAALILAVAVADWQPVQRASAFDFEHVLLIAIALTAVWTVSLLAIALAYAKHRRSERRRGSGSVGAFIAKDEVGREPRFRTHANT